MKKILTAVLFFLSANSYSQNYFLTVDNEAFNYLTNPDTVSGTAPWGSPNNSSTINFGWDFYFNSQKIATTANINFEDGKLLFPVYNANNNLVPNDVTMFGFFGAAMMDLGTSTTLSPISWQTTGSTPNRIVKTEWRNCGSSYDSNVILNLQIWFYETSNDFEIRYGDLTIPNVADLFGSGTGPTVGFYDWDAFDGVCDYMLMLKNDPASPTPTSCDGSEAWDNELTGVPTDNMVYRFTRVGTGINDVEPNTFTVESNNRNIIIFSMSGESDIQIFDLAGKLVWNSDISAGYNSFDLSVLSCGMYMLKLFDHGNMESEKIILR